MENIQTVNSTNALPRRWPLFALGLLLFVVGPVLYFGQISLKQLWTPWYLPALATIGIMLMCASVRQRRGAWRSVGLLLFSLLCVAEWYLMLVAAKTPVYSGPAQAGSRLPSFAATLADGTPFTNKDVENEIRSVLVFNRGRW